jgi:hypothetical protein
MKRSATLGAALIAACAAALAPALVSPAMAGGWHRDGYAAPRSYRSAPRYYDGGVRYYNSPRAYRSACGYGDCACLRRLAIRTGNPVWWDKYQACTG